MCDFVVFVDRLGDVSCVTVLLLHFRHIKIYVTLYFLYFILQLELRDTISFSLIKQFLSFSSWILYELCNNMTLSTTNCVVTILFVVVTLPCGKLKLGGSDTSLCTCDLGIILNVLQFRLNGK